jgi:hypothetical protein
MILNELAPACTMCERRIANKEDLKKHMIFKAAKGNIDAKFLVNASTKKISCNPTCLIMEFKCAICEDTVADPQLKAHMQSI